MTFTRTWDYRLVEGILKHPKLYRAAADDSTPPVAEYRLQPAKHIWHVLVRDDGGLICGVFSFVPETATRWRCHVAMLPHAWGARAFYAGREIAAWLWANSACLYFTGEITASNRLAIRYAARVMGMTRIGTFARSVSRGGERIDEILFGLERPQGT